MPRPIKNLKSLLAGRRMFANGGEVYGGPSGILASSQPLMESARRPVMPPWIGPRTPWGPQGGGGNVQGSVNQASGTLGTAQNQLNQAASRVASIRNTLGPGGQQGGFPRPRPGGPGWPGGNPLAGIFGNLGQQGMGGMKPAAPTPMTMAQGGVARLQDGGLPFRFSEDAMRRFKTPDPGYLESITVKGPTPKRRLPPPGTGPISLDPTTPPLDRGGDAPQGDPPMPEIMQTNLAQSITENYPGMPPEQIQEVISYKQNNPDVSIDEIIRVSYPSDVVASFSGQEAPPQAEAEFVPASASVSAQANLAQSIIGNYPGMTTDQVQEVVFNKQTNPESSVDDIMSTFYTTDEISALREGISTETQTLTPEGDILKDVDREAVLSGEKDLADISMNFTLDPDGNIIRKGRSPEEKQDIGGPMGIGDSLGTSPVDTGGEGFEYTEEPEPTTLAEKAQAAAAKTEAAAAEKAAAKGPRDFDEIDAISNLPGDADETEASAAGTIAKTFGKKMTPKEATRDLKFYVNEFKENLPEYEGMSDQEKGFLLMDAGLRVMAGQSPNAITNIANGLKGIGAEFAKDKKEKRKWDRQVELSAAKYGLEAMNKQRALLDQDKRQLYMFYDQSKATKDNPFGEIEYVSRQDLMAAGNKLPSKYKSEKFVLAQIKGANDLRAKLAKLTADARKGKTIDYKEAAAIDLSLDKAKTAFVSGEVGINLLQGVIKKLVANPDDIVGGTAEATSLWGKAMNFLGRPTSQSYKNRAEAERDIKRAFQKLIPITLGSAQTANSISNRDVQFLADAYIDNGFLNPDGKGGFSIALSTANPGALVRQLQGAVKEFRDAQDSALTVFDQKLYRVGQATPGPYGPKYFESAVRKLAPLAESYRKRISRTGQKAPSTLRVFDYFDRKTGKLLKPLPGR